MFKEVLDKIIGERSPSRAVKQTEADATSVWGIFKTVCCVAVEWSLEGSSVQVLKPWK